MSLPRVLLSVRHGGHVVCVKFELTDQRPSHPSISDGLYLPISTYTLKQKIVSVESEHLITGLRYSDHTLKQRNVAVFVEVTCVYDKRFD